MANEGTKAKWQMALSMAIFGTIGLVRVSIPLSSAMIAAARGLIGAVFLAAAMLLRRQKPDLAAVRRQGGKLFVTGALLGLNWILLFEAYRYTSVAVATVCYDMAPVLVLLCSPLILREKLTRKTVICACVSVAGVVLISGIWQAGGAGDLRGIAFGLGAAVLYASLVLANKRISGIGPMEKTIVQLFSAFAVLLPYVLLSGESGADCPASGWVLLVVAGIVHTGVAYRMYFASLSGVPGRTAALMSYIDPAVAVLCSVLILRVPMLWYEMLGAALMLGSAVCGEVSFGRSAERKGRTA